MISGVSSQQRMVSSEDPEAASFKKPEQAELVRGRKPKVAGWSRNDELIWFGAPKMVGCNSGLLKQYPLTVSLSFLSVTLQRSPLHVIKSYFFFFKSLNSYIIADQCSSV